MIREQEKEFIMLSLKAFKILNERLADLERIQKMYQSTQVQNDILETKEAIAELENLISKNSCDGCIDYGIDFCGFNYCKEFEKNSDFICARIAKDNYSKE